MSEHERDGAPRTAATDGGDVAPTTTRRRVLAATAAAGGLAAGLDAGAIGTASGGITAFDDLSVDADNRIVDESDDVFVPRGVSIPDPRRMHVSRHVRGKTATQLVDLLTDNTAGWYPRVIRVPASPVDIGGHPMGDTGPTYGTDHPAVQDGDFPASRNRQQPPQPPAFDETRLRTYLRNHYDPVVQRCRERGVYCIVDFHRHWHEQPPGDGQNSPQWNDAEGDANVENHLAYDSPYTNYWAYNEFYGTDKPASWGWVDQKYRNTADDPYFNSVQDVRTSTDHPYTAWRVNEPLVQEAITFWDVVAERYADEPHVIFEPYNEPTAPGIWGPAEGGCGWQKQPPLWETFRDEFAAPIMHTIRTHAPGKLLLMGLPGWCQATQALHWGGFDEAGLSNVAVTWHNFAGHAVSDEQNWLNDTDYGDSPCNGWEPYESQGLQNAMDVHPVVVTEFGWQEPEYTSQNTTGSVDIPIWCSRCTTTSNGGTTAAYGKPLLDAMESDDRIGWVAWVADVRLIPALFRSDFTVVDDVGELTNGSWYDTPTEDLPVNCANLPCDWKLWQNPNMGQHIKDRLAAHSGDVPLPTDVVGTPTETPTPTPGPNATETPTPEPTPSAWPDGTVPTDPNDDGIYEDLNGNGEFDSDDVVTYFQNIDQVYLDGHPEFYDVNGNGLVDFDDVVQLFQRL